MIETINIDSKTYILIGTAHVSQESVEEVKETLLNEKPDTVCIELCQQRYDTIVNNTNWKNMDIVQVIREKRIAVLFINLLLSAFQKKIGDSVGIRPGSELKQAITTAQEENIHIEVIDRNIRTTLKRLWSNLRLRDKLRFFSELIASFFVQDSISKEEIEALKNKDMLEQLLENFGGQLPTLKETLIDERDAYMAQKLRPIQGEKIAVVVGAGHLPGIVSILKGDNTNISSLETLEEMPKPKITTRLLKWLLPALVLALFAYGFTKFDFSHGWNMFKTWFWINAALAAVGTVLARGHWITVIVAFVAAPFTSLNPAIAAGWVAGLTEAIVRKPKVEDIDHLHNDITSLSGWYKNKVTRILLVIALANLGSFIGSLIGVYLLASFI